MRLPSRSSVKKFAAWTLNVVIAAVIVAPLGEFFIRLADRRGWYNQPDQAVRIAHDFAVWLGWLTGTAAFHWIGGLVTGFAVGMRLDDFIRRRERAGAVTHAPPVVTPEEMFEMEFARTVWMDTGCDTCRAVEQALDNITRHHAGELHYVRLLKYPRDQLKNAVEELNRSVSLNVPVPFTQLQKSLEALVSAYALGVQWLNEYLANNPSYEADERRHVPKWREMHEKFHDALVTTLGGRSRFGHLRIRVERDSRKIRLPDLD
jgi:hypothetical protein